VFSRVGAYLKTAFTTKWNLLLFGGGVAAAFISGFPGIILPLVAAGEVYYLASMLANDRFRSAVEAQDAKSRRATEAAGAREAYERIRKNLPPALLKRFDQLRDHCLKLVELGGSIRGPDGSGPDKTALESLDRLLWGYLRMIWGANTLSDFLDRTDDGAIRARIADLERRLAKMPKDDPGSAAMRGTLEDHLKTSRERLDNIDEARRKLDLVAAEIERLEAKIAALAESSVAKRDVTDIAQRVDEVAEGMRKTDETMRQLQLPPELEDLDEPPAMLREEA
jgi:predicted  nucleic acid-binding Zn-ribbon protein